MRSIRRLNNSGPAYWAGRPAGDTIVEVMIAAALVMATLGIGYALARQGLRQTTDDSLRTQAISYGQSQIEFIRNAISNHCPSGDTTCSIPNTLLETYEGGALSSGFCILNSGTASLFSDGVCTNYTGATTAGTSPFSIKNTYDSVSKVFSVLVQWTPIGTTRDATSKQQLTLYYKAP